VAGGGGGGGKSGFLPSSFRMISSYLRTVSLNADTIVSTVRSATASVASAISPVDDRQQREQVSFPTSAGMGPRCFCYLVGRSASLHADPACAAPCFFRCASSSVLPPLCLLLSAHSVLTYSSVLAPDHLCLSLTPWTSPCLPAEAASPRVRHGLPGVGPDGRQQRARDPLPEGRRARRLPPHHPPPTRPRPPDTPHSDTHLAGAHPLLCTVLRTHQAPHEDQYLGPFADPEEEPRGALGGADPLGVPGAGKYAPQGGCRGGACGGRSAVLLPALPRVCARAAVQHPRGGAALQRPSAGGGPALTGQCLSLIHTCNRSGE